MLWFNMSSNKQKYYCGSFRELLISLRKTFIYLSGSFLVEKRKRLCKIAFFPLTKRNKLKKLRNMLRETEGNYKLTVTLVLHIKQDLWNHSLLERIMLANALKIREELHWKYTEEGEGSFSLDHWSHTGIRHQIWELVLDPLQAGVFFFFFNSFFNCLYSLRHFRHSNFFISKCVIK